MTKMQELILAELILECTKLIQAAANIYKAGFLAQSEGEILARSMGRVNACFDRIAVENNPLVPMRAQLEAFNIKTNDLRNLLDGGGFD